jgi:hypothetical protein
VITRTAPPTGLSEAGIGYSPPAPDSSRLIKHYQDGALVRELLEISCHAGDRGVLSFKLGGIWLCQQGLGPARRTTGIGRKAIGPDAVGKVLGDRSAADEHLDLVAQAGLG